MLRDCGPSQNILHASDAFSVVTKHLRLELLRLEVQQQNWHKFPRLLPRFFFFCNFMDISLILTIDLSNLRVEFVFLPLLH